ncbi:MAG TPA: BT4734/BF3469 family protein [Luteibaculaceae bacterium]|nr:BT4734/BF3469 family protein [Luteibaculaceae bacterium]
MEVTVFRSIRDVATPFFKPVDFVFDRIKTGASKDLVNQIRSESDKAKRNELKKQLPSVCFSGKFATRKDDSLIEHSGLICLDFDGFDTLDKAKEYKAEICLNPFVFACFISPSGNGVKVVVKIPPDKKNHLGYFRALQARFDSPHFDTSCGNLSRVCYGSYDPEIYINKSSEVWTECVDLTQKSLDTDKPVLKLKSTNEIINRLMKWWVSKYGMIDGERNKNTFILASAFNDFGVPKNEALNHCMQFEQSDFKQREIEQIVNSAYQKTENFGSKFMDDNTSISRIERAIVTGKSIKTIRQDFPELTDDELEKVVDHLDETSSINTFWKKTKKGTITVSNRKFRAWLEQNGFFKYYPSGTDSFVFVRRENNLVDNTNESRIKDHTMRFLDEIEDGNVWEYFSSKPGLFAERYLNMISSIDILTKRDTKDTCYLFYLNCAVEVTKDNIRFIDYFDLNGNVWKNQIIQRRFELSKKTDNDFQKYLNNVAGDGIEAFETTFGYMVHNFKPKHNNKAIILNDQTISSNPEGGTGKGIFVQGLKSIRNTAVLDGKTFDDAKSFNYQTVSADTQILVFDDVRKDFNFESKFSLVTEGITLEKKNKDAIKLSVEDSPKILITTNYAIKGAGNSHERRRHELELRQYYGKDKTPRDEFGRDLFNDWDEDDWMRFDNYVIKCIQKYLRFGLLVQKTENLTLRKLISDIGNEFIEWASDNIRPTANRLDKKHYYELFCQEFPDLRRYTTQNRFVNMIEKYATFKGWRYTSGHSGVTRWFQLLEKDQEPAEDDKPW